MRMATITYDGVPSAEGGNIFQNVRFWVSQRVPQRGSILDKIQSNGGVLVPLEKDADLRIADHARKDAPHGSYSWKLVTDSVEHGSIQLEDKYYIGLHPDMSIPVRTGAHAKNSRVRYTQEDDAFLAKWVLAHLGDQAGNKIYMELEGVNSRHTWQSWRDRWLKSLRMRSMSDLQILAARASSMGESSGENANESSASAASNAIAAIRSKLTRERPIANAENLNSDRPSTRHKKPQVTTAIDEDAGRQETAERPKAGRNSKSHHTTDLHQEATIPDSDIGEDEDEVIDDVEPREAHLVEEDEGTFTPKDQFYDDFRDYLDANDLVIDLVIDLKTDIEGEKLELWELLQAVLSQKVPPEEQDWRKVAEDLGFDWVQNPQIIDKLSWCYDTNLAGFMEAMASFSPDDDEPEMEEPSSPQSFVSSSPPVGSHQKKRQRGLQPSSTGRLSKRAKLSPTTTIPTTPDEEIGIFRPQPLLASQSPSLRKSLFHTRPSGNHQDVQELPQLQTPENSSGRAHRKARNQPATPTQPHERLPVRENSVDFTPSQQLRSEAEGHTPIPLRLERRSNSLGSPSRRAPQPAKEQPKSLPQKPASSTQGRKRALPSSFRPTQVPVSSQKPTGRQDDTVTKSKPHTSKATHEKKQRELNDWIDHYMSLGYSDRIVREALRRTTLTPGGLAGIVMQSLKEGHGVPTHHEGIWTDRDDTSLLLVDSVDTTKNIGTPEEARRLNKAKKEWGRIVEKHGLERVELRRRFLEAEAEAAASRDQSKSGK